MEFITHTVVAILTGYLAFTNTLADKINTLLPQEPESYTQTESLSTTPSLAALPSELGSFFSNILRNSTEYQKASVITGVSAPTATTTDPRSAVVNIVCTFTTKESIRTTTGTGFFVHQSGVVLTNAHVAQYLLLAETTALGDASCVVKSSDTNTPQYLAELLYLPPTWIQANATGVTEKVPMGTGERDYALLYITGTRTRAPLPAAFPTLTIDSDLLSHNTKETAVAAIGYPAASAAAKTTDLPLVYATTSVSDLFTFGSTFADVISLRGSAVGAGGASGGPVLDATGRVIGMITTRGNDEADGQGSLRAITTSHIARTIEEETGFSLERNISGDVPTRARAFNKTMVPFLLTFLTKELE